MSASFELNAAQRAAVEHPGGALLVLAGAGSGKTRVLTARVARLLALGLPPAAVLAFTFTNRAAREMRERIEREVGAAAAGLWVGTFHATAVRILRHEARVLGFDPGFVIYDREDQEAVLREVMRGLGIAEGELRPGTVLERISDAKNALVDADELERLAAGAEARQVALCYRRYQQELRRARALDFDDLIAEVVRLLRDHPEPAGRWRRRFQHVLVDEYQDTNRAQFQMVRGLSSHHGNLFVVGDDDQSIYGWRGADLANVLEFEAAFPGAAVLRLEQNYRSSGTILRAANGVIAHNRGRRGKTLWCEREGGPPLRFALARDEQDEAGRVRRFLEERVRAGGRLAECAVLYRTNAQSRALETELRRAGIPYEMVGGISFFQRREVKDLLAYLRLALNPADAVSFWRVWNTPRRGLGPAVRTRVEARIAADGVTAIEALRGLVQEGGLGGAAQRGAGEFLAVVDGVGAQPEAPVERLLRQVLQQSGYLRQFEELETREAEDRRGNVEELLAAAEQFAAAGAGGLAEFLAETALLTDADRLSEGADRVLLLTAHSAKGLEFDAVIVTGLEEGLFPHASALGDPRELEEERRLFYVALTRAREHVLLTAAAYRRRHDGVGGGAVSRFVDEIPAAVLEREPSAASRADEAAAPWRVGGGGRRRGWRDEGAAGEVVAGGVAYGAADGRLARLIGREVHHERFGRGVVVDAEETAGDFKFTVRFGTELRKVLGRYLSGGSDADQP